MIVLVVVSLAATAISGCGSSKPTQVPANAVALIGDTPISKATLDHWMHSMVGGDFYERFGTRAAHGLVSEPPNYAACTSAAATMTAASGRQPPFTSSQLLQKCRQLNQAIEEQALTFLISAQWRTDEAAEHGITISDAELAAESKQSAAQQFPKPGEFDTYLANHEWALSDELYQLKRNLLTTKLREKISHLSPGGEETPQARATFVSFIEGNIKKRTATTLCRPAYMVATCRGYKAPSTPTPAPIVILEELTTKQ